MVRIFASLGRRAVSRRMMAAFGVMGMGMLCAQEVGVGTTAPAVRLDIQAPATYSSDLFRIVHGSATYVLVTNTGRLGVGAVAPVARLHVANDGMVYAEGAYGSGDTFPPGPKTAFIWNPRKAAIRAGRVDGTQWDDSLVGAYSVGFGHNNISAHISTTVSGGSDNAATGWWATVGGGRLNVAEGEFSVVGGGLGNQALEHSAAIGGGKDNYIDVSCLGATIAGGLEDSIMGNGYGSTIGGGMHNKVITGRYAVIGGGRANSIASTITWSMSVIGGGYLNRITHPYAVIGGGTDNTVASYWGTVAGGTENYVAGRYGTVGGGWRDTVWGWAATIAGGESNIAQGDYSTVGGGGYNIAQGNYSFAVGHGVQAPSYGEMALGIYNTLYVPADSVGWNAGDRLFVVGNGSSPLARSNALVILKNGKVGIGVDSPTVRLEVAAAVNADWAAIIKNVGGTGYGLRIQSGAAAAVPVLAVVDNYNNERFRVQSDGKVGVGTTAPAAVFDVAGEMVMSAVGGVVSGHAGFYRDAGGEVFVFDASGNATQISPHNARGEWHFNSWNVKTGRHLVIDVERLLTVMDQMLGGGYVRVNGEAVHSGANQIESLKAEVERLRHRNAQLEERIQRLEAKLESFDR